MKRLGRVLGSLFAIALTFASLQAVAETQVAGRDFNHMATGFPLSGAHAAAACETCHMGGIFKGTPRACDGCHTVGSRIVAMPKSNNHIITDAPCDSCHFNAATFLGARFNHGTAKTGQCANCHNGRIATGKPTNHLLTTYSCDQCHRSSAWIPASWNHTGVTGDCVACHNAAGPGRNYTSSHMSQSVMTAMGISGCNTCHKNFYSFSGAYYDHAGASTSCGNCHANAAYVGVVQKASAIHNVTAAMGLNSCQSCHKSYASFTGAAFDHVTTSACATCHSGVYTTNGNVLGKGSVAGFTHVTTTAACNTCHTSTTTWLGASNHSGVIAGICGTCHDGVTAKGKSSIPLHIPTTGNNCDLCHTSTSSFATWTMNHTGAPATACNPCHASTAPAYPPGLTRKTIGSHEGSRIGQDCVNCHNRGISWSAN